MTPFVTPPTYSPKFVCPHCGKEMYVNVLDTLLVLCDCKESRAAWETEHRATMERRKKARRR